MLFFLFENIAQMSSALRFNRCHFCDWCSPSSYFTITRQRELVLFLNFTACSRETKNSIYGWRPRSAVLSWLR